MVTIDKDVPLPLNKAEMYRQAFSSMRVGESFAVDAGQKTAVRVARWREQRRNVKKRFTTRVANGEIRVWRIR